MPDLIPLSKLNELRHKSCPKSLRTLRHHANNGAIPGAVWIYGGWHVDLEQYDKSLLQKMSAEPIIDAIALDVLNKLEIRKAS